jgi:hypothetical protein
MSQLRTNSIVPVGGIPAGASGGGIIQIVSTTKTDTYSQATTTFTDVTGLSATITPRSSNSKVLITWQITLCQSNQNLSCAMRLMRGSTAICVGDAASTRKQSTAMFAQIGSGDHQFTVSGSFLDSPSTTSATTYKLQIASEGGDTVQVNRNAQFDNDSTDPKFSRSSSTITVYEVSG